MLTFCSPVSRVSIENSKEELILELKMYVYMCVCVCWMVISDLLSVIHFVNLYLQSVLLFVLKKY